MWSALEWGLPSGQFAALDALPMRTIKREFDAWEKRCGITVLEIAGIIRAIDAYGMEIEYDLICLGTRLRYFPSPECTWRDLLVILRMSGPHARFTRVANPEGAQWDLTNLLLAEVVDTQRWLQWAKTESAQDPNTMPKPIPRPGVKSAKENVLKGRKMPLGKAKERFDRPDPERTKKLHALFRK